MSDDNESNDQLEKDVAKVLPEFRRLMREYSYIDSSIPNEAEWRAAHIENHRRLMRAAFLTNEMASEEDFERLWPRLLDNNLIDHAHAVYMQTMEALMDELHASDDEDSE